MKGVLDMRQNVEYNVSAPTVGQIRLAFERQWKSEASTGSCTLAPVVSVL